MKTYIGCDPGKNGGIAFLWSTGMYTAQKMPDTEKDLWDLLETFKRDDEGKTFALLELVHSSPQMGVKSAFTFGQGYGALRMALVAAGIAHECVRPQAWQKALGCLSGGDKNKTKSRAQQLFPSVKVTHWNADALLIAEHARRLAL
jgi:Holliday junction resolvasome RuvABC endonuclease subunit